MGRRQPQSMVKYTDETGFKKIKAPEKLWTCSNIIGRASKDYNNCKHLEECGIGNISTNNWAAPTYMVSFEDRGLQGTGRSMKNRIWEAARPTIEEWTGMKVQPTSLYGICVFLEGAILAPHVDQLPLVSSFIINVAQDVKEDWILEVYDRHDRAVNVTMEPGDMVLYESGSLIHDRPFPLKGNFYANIFIHFEPTGQHLYDSEWDALDDFFPPYLVGDSPVIDNWARRNPSGWKKQDPPAAGLSRPKGHVAASRGDVQDNKQLAREYKQLLHKKDESLWQPIHEAARAGNLDVIKLLVETRGADINSSVTNFGDGSSVYNVAIQAFSPDHPVALYCTSDQKEL